MDKISTLYRRDLRQLLEEVFTAHFDAPFILRFEHLQLDLGQISYENLERDLPPAFKKALLEKLINLPYQAEQITVSNKIEVADAGAEMLLIFFQTGRLPWWAGKQLFNPAKLLEKLNILQVLDLIEKIKKGPFRGRVIKRIAWQLPPTTIEGMIAIWRPSDAGFISTMVKEILQIYQKKSLPNVGRRYYRCSLWEIVLANLFKLHASSLDKQLYVEYVVEDLVRKFRLSSYQLLLELKSISVLKPYVEKILIISLPVSSVRYKDFSSLQLFRFFLENAYLPVATNLKELLRDISQSIPKRPKVFRQLFQKLLVNRSIRWRLIRQMPEQLLWQILELLNPKRSKKIKARLTWLTGAERKWTFLSVESRFLFEQTMNIALEADLYSEQKTILPDYWNKIISVIANKKGCSSGQLLQDIGAVLEKDKHPGGPSEKNKYAEVIIELRTLVKSGTSKKYLPKQIEVEEFSKLDKLALFLQFGIFPGRWKEEKNSIETLIETLLIEEEYALVVLLRQIGRQVLVRNRMALQLELKYLHYIIVALEPQAGAQIIQFSNEILSLRQKESFKVVAGAAFQQQLWEYILTYLFMERGATFNERIFTRSIHTKLETQYPLQFGDTDSNTPSTFSRMEAVLFFLENGVGPIWAGHPTQKELQKWLNDLLVKSPNEFRKTMQEAESKQLIAWNSQFLLPPRYRHKIFSLYDQGSGYYIQFCKELSRQKLLRKKQNIAISKLEKILQYHSLIYCFQKNNQQLDKSDHFRYLSVIMQLEAAPGLKGSISLLKQLRETELFLQFLYTGKWPTSLLPIDSLDTILTGFLQNRPRQLYLAFKQTPLPFATIDYLIKHLKQDHLSQLQQLLFPRDYTKFLYFQRILSEAIVSLSTKKIPPNEEKKLAWRTMIKGFRVSNSADKIIEETIIDISRKMKVDQLTLIEILKDKLGHESSPPFIALHRSLRRFSTTDQKIMPDWTSLESKLDHLSAALQWINEWQQIDRAGLKMTLIDGLRNEKFRRKIGKINKLKWNRKLISNLIDRTKAKQVDRFYKLIKKASRKYSLSKEGSYLIDYFWQHLWNYLAALSDPSKFDVDYFLSGLLQTIALQQRLPLNKVVAALRNAIDNETGPTSIKLKSVLDRLAPGVKEDIPYKKLGEPKPRKMTGESIFIQNAGLILCWPFLNQLFQKAGLDIKNNEEHAERAVHLLQYMVNGEMDTPEYELVLNKILCGIALERPIAAGIDVGESEKELCNQMLNSVIRNWKVIQETSKTQFQVSFLQREGKITEAEDYWFLQVEKKPYDLLLQKLPWRLSPVYFSWMDKKIEVQWIEQ